VNERYKRQSFLGPRSEEIVGTCVAAIVGVGGGGSHIAQQLAHLGVQNFRLFDPDQAEESNLNRLVGARPSDIADKMTKTTISSRLIKAINPAANVMQIEARWQESHRWLRDCDVIFGCVDTYVARQELEIAARRYLAPYIDIGMDVLPLDEQFTVSGQVILSMPGGLCMRCLGFLRDDLLTQEAQRYGVAGDHPQVVWANGVLASVAVGVFTQLFTPWHNGHSTTAYLEYDGNTHTVAASNRLAHMKNRWCPHFQGIGELGDPFWVPEEITDPHTSTKGEAAYGKG
jgi:hypothetical protein